MIGIIGSTGSTGRALVAALKSKGADFKCLVRDTARAAETLGTDVALVEADTADPDSVRAGLAGCDKLFLLLGHSPVMETQLTNAIEAAKAAGVNHIVKLSGGPNIAVEDCESFVGRAHWKIDEDLKADGIDWTILQPGFFMQNLLNMAPMVKGMGKMMMPLPADLNIGMIDVRDTGDAAAEILTSGDHAGKAYFLTGGTVTPHQAANAISSAIGKPVDFVEVPLAGAVAAMKERGMPDWLVGHQEAMMKLAASGKMEATSGTLQELTGKPARGIDDFARDFAGAYKD